MKFPAALGVVLLLSSVLLSSGCWDRTEVNDLALVMATALDVTKDGKLLTSVQVAVPSQLSGGQSGGGAAGGDPSKTFIVESSTGRDLHDIDQKIQERLSRRLYVAHRRVLLIGEPLAKKGIKDILDQFGRDPTSRLRTYVMVTKGTDAYKILDLPSPLERVPAEALRESERSGIGTEITMRDLMMASSSEGITPVMAAVEMVKAKDNREGQDKVRLSSTAIFKNFKLVGYLNDPETRGLLWVNGKLEKGIITAYVPEGKGDVSLTITRAQRKIKTNVQGKKVTVFVDLTCEGTIPENNTDLDLSQPINIQRAEKALQASLYRRVRQTVDKTQKVYKADVFGFGQEIHRKHPEQWRNLRNDWVDLYPQAKVNVSVHLHVLRSGMSGAPLQLPDNEVKKQ